MMGNVEIFPGKYITCSKEVEKEIKKVLQGLHNLIEEQNRIIEQLKNDFLVQKHITTMIEYNNHKLLQGALSLLSPDDELNQKIDDLLRNCTNPKCKAEK